MGGISRVYAASVPIVVRIDALGTVDDHRDGVQPICIDSPISMAIIASPCSRRISTKDQGRTQGPGPMNQRPTSVRRRVSHAVDENDVHGSALGLQLQSQLILD